MKGFNLIIKKNNKAEIDEWALNNQIKIIRTGKAKGATLNGSICSGGFSASGLAQSRSRENYLKNKPANKGKHGNRKRNKEKRKEIWKEKIKNRKKLRASKRRHYESIIAFKAKILDEYMDLEMIRAMERDS